MPPHFLCPTDDVRRRNKVLTKDLFTIRSRFLDVLGQQRKINVVYFRSVCHWQHSASNPGSFTKVQQQVSTHPFEKINDLLQQKAYPLPLQRAQVDIKESFSTVSDCAMLMLTDSHTVDVPLLHCCIIFIMLSIPQLTAPGFSIQNPCSPTTSPPWELFLHESY